MVFRLPGCWLRLAEQVAVLLHSWMGILKSLCGSPNDVQTGHVFQVLTNNMGNESETCHDKVDNI